MYNTEFLEIVLDILKEIKGEIKKIYIPYIKSFIQKHLKILTLRKNRINPAIFRMFSISSQLISRWLRGFFIFSDSFQFVFRFSILYLL